jgi:quinol monooxygenase YgiN
MRHRAGGITTRDPYFFADDMTIIVAGQIEVQPGQRQRFLDGSQMAMRLARETTGCEDFVVAADPLDEHRVNVFEVWRSRKALHDFRDAGPDDDLTSLIVRARVREYEV